MAKSRYKTRGMSSPQGKPRAYFCCHPADFQTYFETVSNEVLVKQQNCDDRLQRSGSQTIRILCFNLSGLDLVEICFICFDAILFILVGINVF